MIKAIDALYCLTVYLLIQGKVDRWSCPQCDMTFSTKNHIQRHISRVHDKVCVIPYRMIIYTEFNFATLLRLVNFTK